MNLHFTVLCCPRIQFLWRSVLSGEGLGKLDLLNAKCCFPCWYLLGFSLRFNWRKQYVLWIPLKWSAICLKSWTSNRIFSNSTGGSDILVCRWRSWCDKHVRIHLELVLQSEIDRVCLFKARFEWEHDHWGWPNSQHSRELVGLKSSWYMLAFSASRALRSISFHSPNEHCWSMLWFLFLPFFLFLDGSEMCGHVLVMLKVHSSHGFLSNNQSLFKKPCKASLGYSGGTWLSRCI